MYDTACNGFSLELARSIIVISSSDIPITSFKNDKACSLSSFAGTLSFIFLDGVISTIDIPSVSIPNIAPLDANDGPVPLGLGAAGAGDGAASTVTSVLSATCVTNSSTITKGLLYLTAFKSVVSLSLLIIHDNSVPFRSSVVNSMSFASTNLPPAFSTLSASLPSNN